MKDAERAWEDLRVQAFWDRAVSLHDWREGFFAGSPSYGPQTLRGIRAADAIPLLGAAEFVQAWPALREVYLTLLPDMRRRIRTWDSYWSREVSGTADIAPLEAWARLPRRTREFLVHVARRPGDTIYGAAKAIGATYRRAHDHYRRLSALGFLKESAEVSGGRRRTRLYAVNPLNAVVNSDTREGL